MSRALILLWFGLAVTLGGRPSAIADMACSSSPDGGRCLAARMRGCRALAALWGVAGAAAAWNVYLVTLYPVGAISRPAPVTWAEMLSAAARLPEAIRF